MHAFSRFKSAFRGSASSGLLLLLACRAKDGIVLDPVDTGDPPDTATSPVDSADSGYDCDTADPAVHPGADEVCNGHDDDCDGLIDGQDPDVIGASTWYADTDGDGYGDPDAAFVSCEPLDGYVSDASDCDDGDPALGGPEICNGLDDDCDGLVDGQDEDVVGASTWYPDADDDGYGASDAPFIACERPPGHVADGEDCDDTDAAVGGGDEVCDDRDNDCDGLVDGDDDSVTGGATWYADTDGDAYGDPDVSTSACDRPDGYVSDGSDCDDGDATRGGPEVCDDVDNDCDGLTDGQDDSLDGGTVWYHDVDEDGYGDPDSTFFACSHPNGYVDNAHDCDDTDPDAGLCATEDDGTRCASLIGTDDGQVPAYTGDCDASAGFASYGGHCYYAVSSSGNWPDARASCMAAGGYLATIGDSGENTWIQSLNSRPHVGGCDADAEGTWVWITGEAFSFTSWSTGEPNDMSGEDCLEDAYGGALWNDIWCSANPYTQGYVCEFE